MRTALLVDLGAESTRQRLTAQRNASRSAPLRAFGHAHTGPMTRDICAPGDTFGTYVRAEETHGIVRFGWTDTCVTLRFEHASSVEGVGRSVQNLNGCYTDDDGNGDTMQPIVARLPRQRGFLAGWTLGNGMCATFSRHVYVDAVDAAYDACTMAEDDAERERDYQRSGQAEEDYGA